MSNPPRDKTIQRTGAQVDFAAKRSAMNALSPFAYMVLDYLQTHAAGWQLSVDHIARELNRSAATIYRAFDALRSGGFLETSHDGSILVRWRPSTDSQKCEPARATLTPEKKETLSSRESARDAEETATADSDDETAAVVSALVERFANVKRPARPRTVRKLLAAVAALHIRPAAYIARRVDEMGRRRLALPAMLRFIVEDAEADSARVEARLSKRLIRESVPETKPLPDSPPCSEWLAALERLREIVDMPAQTFAAVFERMRIRDGAVWTTNAYHAAWIRDDYADAVAAALGKRVEVRFG